jgi:hypothetical protein
MPTRLRWSHVVAPHHGGERGEREVNSGTTYGRNHQAKAGGQKEARSCDYLGVSFTAPKAHMIRWHRGREVLTQR